LEKVTS